MNDGAMMAASDQFEIKITGLGGHAAMPQETIDPIIVAARYGAKFAKRLWRGILTRLSKRFCLSPKSTRGMRLM